MPTLTTSPCELDLLLTGQDELPSEDNQTMETQRHKMQMDLLIEGLDPLSRLPQKPCPRPDRQNG